MKTGIKSGNDKKKWGMERESFLNVILSAAKNLKQILQSSRQRRAGFFRMTLGIVSSA